METFSCGCDVNQVWFKKRVFSYFRLTLVNFDEMCLMRRNFLVLVVCFIWNDTADALQPTTKRGNHGGKTCQAFS